MDSKSVWWQSKNFKRFVKEQSKDGAFVDDSGIAVIIITAEVLDVVIHMESLPPLQ